MILIDCKGTKKKRKKRSYSFFLNYFLYLCARIDVFNMSVRVQDVIDALEDFAPLPLQESYDNAGLQVGLTGAEVSGALLCLDVTEEVIAEALELGCNMIVSHHPLIFRGLKHLTDEDTVQRCVRMALQNDIAIYSAHTNLDSAIDGVNYMMAERLGLVDVVLLQPRQVSVGVGAQARSVQAGSGVIGYLPDGEDSLVFLQRVKQAFGVECLMHNELLSRPVHSVAICGGAGDFLLQEALNLQADAFLTGEMHYHQYFGHDGQIQIGVLGHYQSEQYTMDIFNSVISERCPRLPLFKTTVCTNPIKYL